MAGVIRTHRLFFAFSVLSLLPQTVFAGVTMTEIMYDLPGADSGREWIEIFNEGPGSIDLSKLRLFENEVNHKIVAVGSSVVPPGEFAVIADDPEKFRSDWPQFSSQLFESAFSLSNDSETLAIRDGSSDIDAIHYESSTGASGDGNSLSREPGSDSLAPRTPTPGARMAQTAIEPPPKKVSLNTIRSSEDTSKVGGAEPKDTVNEPHDTEEGAGSSNMQTASALIPASNASAAAWWMGAVALAGATGAAIFAGRRYGKKEWDIVEE